MQVQGCQIPVPSEDKCCLTVTEVGAVKSALSTDHDLSGERFECEHTCWDPKDGELCLSRAKPGETLVEARSDCDVQIHRGIWV